MFDHFVELALKGLIAIIIVYELPHSQRNMYRKMKEEITSQKKYIQSQKRT